MVDHKVESLKYLELEEANFNIEQGLIQIHISNYPVYHTSLRGDLMIHPTRESLGYALALLDSEVTSYEQRAFDIIQKVLEVQDKNRNQPTFGIWPWFYEEPLDKMSPPDLNWADFIGKILLLTVIRHEHRYPPLLLKKVEQALFNACEAIINRNMGPHYTNIAVMGAFVTLITGELFNKPSLRDYGSQRLMKFRDYTYAIGAFEEYNSPPYNMVTITELSSIYSESKTDEAKSISRDLMNLAWKMVGEHFHVRTGQWSGPHSRTYATKLPDSILSFIQMGLQDKVKVIDPQRFQYKPEWNYIDYDCPEEYIHYFEQESIRVVDQMYQHDKKLDIKKWAYTYMKPKYSLGTCTQEVMWDQRRNLIAYVDDQGTCSTIRLRCMHDGYDYSSAMFTGTQSESIVLFGINFSTNGGDRHIGLDAINNKIEAEDFRIRFEVTGYRGQVRNTEGSEMKQIGVEKTFKIGDLYMQVKNEFARFDQADLTWEIHELDDELYVDLVIYSGGRKTIDFSEIKEAAFVFVFSLSESPIDINAQITESAEAVEAVCAADSDQLKISIAKKPNKTRDLYKLNRTSRSSI